MKTTRASRPITGAPAPDRPSHLAGIGGGRPGLQGATMSNTRKTSQSAVPSSQEAPVYSEEMADARWTRTRAKPRRKRAQMSGPAPPARPVSKPLASYRLGLLSFTAWLWHKVFWDMPENEETWDGVPFAVDQLREARLVLSDEIHPNVFAALDRVLDDLDHMARTLVEAWQETGTYRGVKFGSRRVPGVGHWEELRLLADRALAGDHQLRPWFDYGAAAGAYQLVLWDYEPDPDDSERLPDIGPLVQQARMLPKALVRKIPLLRSLVEMAPILESDGQGAFLEEFLERNQEECRCFYGEADIPTVNAMGFTLDARVQEALIGLNPEPATRRPAATNPGVLTPQGPTGNSDISPLIPSAVDSRKPRWIRDRGELWVGKKLVRTVSERADFIYILDEFESKGWPDTIDDTHPEGSDWERLRLALRSLNKGTLMIRFGRARKGKGIYWKRVPRPKTP
jgi:hypothetical protein